MKTVSFNLIIVTLLLATASASAAEIRMRSEPVRCTRDLVTLADVAAVLPTNDPETETLRQTVLFTAPAAGETRTLEAAELRTILSSLGIPSTRHTVTGARRIKLVGEESFLTEPARSGAIVSASYRPETAPAMETPAYSRRAINSARPLPAVTKKAEESRLTPQFRRILETQLNRALVTYLNRCLTVDPLKPAAMSWKVSLTLTEEQAIALATSGQIRDITGAVDPLTGPQHFLVVMDALAPNTAEPIIVGIDAEVILPQQVVMLRRSLPKGYIISEADVALRPVENLDGENYYVDLKDVIGHETAKSLKELDIVTPGMIKRPLMVRKGEIVTVTSRFGPSFVKSQGTALQDASDGDTISVEPVRVEPTSRNRRERPKALPSFLARVSGPRSVEIDSTPMQIRD